VILQSTSTQNDLFAGLWCLLTIYFLLFGKKNDLVFAALSLGLAFLSKGTTPIFLLPFFILWAIQKRHYKTRLLAQGMFILLVVLVLNIGHWVRNIQTFGHPLIDPKDSKILSNQVHAPGIIVSNALRN